jgi:nucleotide-binding universal stress UspA family protein
MRRRRTSDVTEPTASEPRVCCAYDGSVNAHWVVRYAIHLAANTPSRALRLVHVRDGHISESLLERKLEHVLGDCARAGVEATTHEVRTRGSVADALREAVPGGAETLLLCGTRARARLRRLLAGTVSESLLRAAHCSVLALRVVLPGLLGAPRRVLMPVAGKPGEGRAASTLLELLSPTLEALHLLHVVPSGHMRSRVATGPALAAMRSRGRAAVGRIEEELVARLPLGDVHLDAYVRIAEDWAGQSIILAGQHKCGLILTGASPRMLGGSVAELRRVERLLAASPCDVGILSVPR